MINAEKIKQSLNNYIAESEIKRDFRISYQNISTVIKKTIDASSAKKRQKSLLINVIGSNFRPILTLGKNNI